MKKIIFTFMLALSLLTACQTADTTPAVVAETLPSTESSPTTAPTVVPTPTPDTTLNAIMEEIEGSVEAKNFDEASFSSAEDGRVIQEEGQVRTYEDGYTRLDLSSGTIIRMAPLSYFTLLENQSEDEGLFTRIKLEIGQIWIVLNGGSLEVETPSGQASVRGSYMMIEIDPETQDALVTCLEGNCMLKNPAGIVELINGQRAKLDFPDLEEDFFLPTIEFMSERDFAEWLYFAPESEAIFPLLEEENLLPWNDWKNYIPDEDTDWYEFEERFPDEPRLDINLLPDDEIFLGEDGLLLDDGILLDGDAPLIGHDGTLLDGLPTLDGPLDSADGPLGGGGIDGPLR